MSSPASRADRPFDPDTPLFASYTALSFLLAARRSREETYREVLLAVLTGDDCSLEVMAAALGNLPDSLPPGYRDLREFLIELCWIGDQLCARLEDAGLGGAAGTLDEEPALKLLSEVMGDDIGDVQQWLLGEEADETALEVDAASEVPSDDLDLEDDEQDEHPTPWRHEDGHPLAPWIQEALKEADESELDAVFNGDREPLPHREASPLPAEIIAQHPPVATPEPVRVARPRARSQWDDLDDDDETPDVTLTGSELKEFLASRKPLTTLAQPRVDLASIPVAASGLPELDLPYADIDPEDAARIGEGAPAESDGFASPREEAGANAMLSQPAAIPLEPQTPGGDILDRLETVTTEPVAAAASAPEATAPAVEAPVVERDAPAVCGADASASAETEPDAAAESGPEASGPAETEPDAAAENGPDVSGSAETEPVAVAEGGADASASAETEPDAAAESGPEASGPAVEAPVVKSVAAQETVPPDALRRELEAARQRIAALEQQLSDANARASRQDDELERVDAGLERLHGHLDSLFLAEPVSWGELERGEPFPRRPLVLSSLARVAETVECWRMEYDRVAESAKEAEAKLAERDEQLEDNKQTMLHQDRLMVERDDRIAELQQALQERNDELSRLKLLSLWKNLRFTILDLKGRIQTAITPRGLLGRRKLPQGAALKAMIDQFESIDKTHQVLSDRLPAEEIDQVAKDMQFLRTYTAVFRKLAAQARASNGRSKDKDVGSNGKGPENGASRATETEESETTPAAGP